MELGPAILEHVHPPVLERLGGESVVLFAGADGGVELVVIGNVVAVLVPDLYQGNEIWDFKPGRSRQCRPVGLKLRRDMLERVQKREP